VADEQPVARFLDPWTLVYERTYPHPIERVFDAVSTGEHLDAWFIPTCTIERKLGGACSFTWGGPAGSSEAGVVTAFDPPYRIRYTLRQGPQGEQYLQFELEATNGGTRLRFTQAFPQGSENPWHPGFAAGYHQALDVLEKFVAGLWVRADMDAMRAYQKAHPSGKAGDIYWMPIYGELIRTQWPARHIRADGDPRCPAVEAYLSAIILRSEDAVTALRPHLADDVVHDSDIRWPSGEPLEVGRAKGPDGVLVAVRNPKLAAGYSHFVSTEIAGATRTGTVTARIAKQHDPFIGFDHTFELRDGQLGRITVRFVRETEKQAHGK
jgi:uncharacterized protein YndB with AHSA1/START domain